jgi:hypothetical protein
MTSDINWRKEMLRDVDGGGRRIDMMGNRGLFIDSEQDCLRLLYNEIAHAISNCRRIALHPYHGPAFTDLMNNIADIERCARRMNGIRLDTRWMNANENLAHVKATAQSWLTPMTPKTKRMFGHLEAVFVALRKGFQVLEKSRPPRLGIIVPEFGRVERTQGRPSQILLPPGFSRHG